MRAQRVISSGSQPRILAGRYRLGNQIGHGGHAAGVHAYDPLLQREVAVKLFHAHAGDPDRLREQELEARTIAGLNHYALTTLYDAGVDSSDPERPQVHLVMEHIPGADLNQRLLRGRMNPPRVARLGADLYDGLAHLHEAGFLHRAASAHRARRRHPSLPPRAKSRANGASTLGLSRGCETTPAERSIE